MLVQHRLKKKFYNDITGLAIEKHGKINGMKDEVLLQAFKENKYLASCYLTEVLLKEGLAAILEKLLKLEYRKADQEGRETETSSLNRSVNIAEKLYEKKKRQYELNISSERQ